MAKIELKENSIKVLKILKKVGTPIEARELCDKMNMEYEVLMTQAVYELSTKKLVKFTEEAVTELIPTNEMREYIQNGLPERQLYKMLVEHGDEYTINDFKENSGMKLKRFFIGLTYMKKNGWARESKATAQPTIFLYEKKPKKSSTEKLLEKFKDKKCVFKKDIPKSLQKDIKILFKRKFVTKNSYNQRIISLTKKGTDIKLKQVEEVGDYITRITPEMLDDGSWKDKIDKLKPFEVKNPGPKLNAGKLHPMTILINQIREIFLSMGFIEIKGPIVETAFYNFDSLYQPQDHPARELHDTFYLSNPKEGKLPEKKWVDAVKETHENGGSSGSTGWKYNWSAKIAKMSLLRTHTTATT
ncbi:MAG: hypothetical protein GF364_19715, partial [Candidatus Lokiarchaeota archaeon]|nr:hypothetical protein [Candidatus Lokiarchaeota archaeon]